MIHLSKNTAFLFLAVAFAPVATAQIPDILSKNVSSSDSNEPTYVTALTMDIDVENNVTTLLGDVVIDDRDVKITCNKMIIYMEDAAKSEDDSSKDKSDGENAAATKSESQKAGAGEAKAEDESNSKKEKEEEEQEGGLFNAAGGGKQVSKIHCIGDVVIVRKKAKESNDESAASDEAVFDVKTNVITMTGKPILNSGRNKMNCAKIEIFLNEGGRMKITQPDGLFFRTNKRGQ